MAKVSKGKNPASETPKQLKEWVQKEMKLSPFTQKNDLQLYEELCRGQMGDVWKFIMAHVKSKENVHHIKGNLQFKESQSVKEKQQESAVALQQMKTEMAETEAAIVAAQRNIQQMRRDLEQKEKLNFKLNSSLDKKLTDNRLIGTFLTESEQLESKFSDANLKLHLTAEETQKRLRQQRADREQIYFPTGTIGEDDFILETACSRDVNECIRPIHSYLSKIVNGDFGVNPFLLNDSKRRLKEKVMSCRERNCAQDLLKCVVDSIQRNLQLFTEKKRSFSHEFNESKKVASLTNTANDKKDVSNTFDYQTCIAGELEHELLAEQRRKDIVELESRLRAVQLSVHDFLNRKLGGEDASALPRELVDAQLKLSSIEARNEFLQELHSELKAAGEYGIETEHELDRKGQQMLECDSILDKRTETLKLLWHQNNYLLSKLQTQQTENKNFVKNVMREQVDEIGASCKALRGSILAEVQGFSQIPAATLAVMDLKDGGRKLEQSLGIYGGNQRRDDVAKLYKTLGLEFYKAPEEIFPRVIELRKEADHLGNTTKLYEDFLVALKSSGEVVPSKRTSEIVEKLEQTYNKKMSILEKLAAVEGEGASGFSTCDETKNSITVWTELPAKNIDVSALKTAYHCH